MKDATSGIVKDVKTEVCAVHGEFQSQFALGRFWTTCPVCAKEKQDEEDKRDAIQFQIDRKANILANLFKRACIPPRFKDRTFDSFVADTEDKQRALLLCRAYAEDVDRVMEAGTSLVFCGRPGTGKTHLAVAIANHIIPKGRSALFSTVSKAVRHIKESWGHDSEMTEREAIATFVTPDLMIFDEVGVQYGSETEQNLIFGIINDRYENRKPTIIISNLDVEGIKSYLGDRAFDRLREDGGKLVPFAWESYRGKRL